MTKIIDAEFEEIPPEPLPEPKAKRDFKIWICNLLYDMKRDAEMERTNDTIHSNLVQ